MVFGSHQEKVKLIRNTLLLVSMDIQNERRRLLDAEGGDEDPTGLISEQEAYMRSVTHDHTLLYRHITQLLNCEETVH